MADLTDLIQQLIDAFEARTDQASQDLKHQLIAIQGDVRGDVNVAGGDIVAGDKITGDKVVQIVESLHQTINHAPPGMQTHLERLSKLLERWATADYTGPQRLITVFVASPDDVEGERATVDEVVERFNRSAWLDGKAQLKVIRWDHPHDWFSLPANVNWQEAVMREQPPSDCDVVVVILWKKMGSKLPADAIKPEDFRFETGDPDLPPERYLGGTEYEFVDAISAADTHGQPVVLVYRRDEPPTLNVADPAFDKQLTQWKQVEGFFSHNFFDEDGANIRGYTAYTGETFRDKLEKQLEREIARLLYSDQQAPASEEADPEPIERWNPAICPFPGLRAFGPDYELVFFGRDREREALLKQLGEQSFVAVVAASGSGKSSLVRAGVVPHVLRGALGPGWKVVTCKPGSDALYSLAEGLLWATEAVPQGADFRDYAADLAERLTDDPEAALAPWADTKLLIVVDQFEELFTLSPAEQREPFAHALIALKGAHKVIVTVRADFSEHWLRLTTLKPLFEQGTYQLYPPGRGQLREMIERPAEVAGLHFEGDLAERIWQETRDEPGALALTAYALEQLWEAANKRGDGILSKDDYASFGGVEGAIGQQAQAAYEALKMDDEAKREALRQVFARLIAVEPRAEGGGYTATRKRADLDAVRGEEGSDTWLFVDAFTDARLLTADHGVLEVAHEALLRQWKLLRDWINEAGEAFRLIEDMKRDARRWRDTGDDIHLWRQERMDRFHAVLAERPELEAELDDERALYNRFLRDEHLRIAEWVVVRDLDHLTRRDYGDRLAKIGDRRPGVGVLTEVVPLDVSASMAPALPGTPNEHLPLIEEVRLWGDHRDHIGLPDIVFVKISPPAEPWTMVDDNGREYGPFTIKPFYLAKYPVTYAQFTAFEQAEDGFASGRWYEGLVRQESDLKDQNRPTGNHPRENINWYDSIAFCRWLNHRLGWPDIPFDLTPDSLPTYKGLRLPTEWEWQFAAQSGDPANTYPWGPEWDGRRANTSESGLSRTTAVGMYPQGTPFYDLSGNVREWCLNTRGDLNLTLTGSDSRVLRGGAFHDARYARASYRDVNDPHFRHTNYGFRVVVGGVVPHLSR